MTLIKLWHYLDTFQKVLLNQWFIRVLLLNGNRLIIRWKMDEDCFGAGKVCSGKKRGSGRCDFSEKW